MRKKRIFSLLFLLSICFVSFQNFTYRVKSKTDRKPASLRESLFGDVEVKVQDDEGPQVQALSNSLARYEELKKESERRIWNSPTEGKNAEAVGKSLFENNRGQLTGQYENELVANVNQKLESWFGSETEHSSVTADLKQATTSNPQKRNSANGNIQMISANTFQWKNADHKIIYRMDMDNGGVTYTTNVGHKAELGIQQNNVKTQVNLNIPF